MCVMNSNQHSRQTMERITVNQVVIIIIVCFTNYTCGQLSNKFAGPYDIKIKQIARCGNPKSYLIHFDKTKIVKYNRTTYLYSCSFHLPYGFSDECDLGVSAKVYGNGGWKVFRQASKLGPACSTLKQFSPSLAESVAKALGQYPKLCPYPPGNYSLTDLPLNVELQIPVLPYNKYMIDLLLYYKEAKIGCGRMLVDVVPKEDRKKKIVG